MSAGPAKNIGHPADVWGRLAVGAVLLSLAFVLQGNARWFAAIGIVPVLTAIFRWCPAWCVLGINTANNAP